MRIPFLDWLRIFAFLSVLVGHKFMAELIALINNPQTHATPKMLFSFLLELCSGGAAGVVVFMMVSGYVITHVLTREHSIEFLIKRLFRIYPLYITAVILQNIILMGYPGYVINWRQLLPQLLLIGDFFDTPHTLAGVEWTLRIEMVFYLFMATVKIFEQIDFSRMKNWDFINRKPESEVGFGMFSEKKNFMTLLFMMVAAIPFLPPFPRPEAFLATDYVWLYGPFLFIGVSFYLLEINKINKTIFSLFIMLVFSVFYQGIIIYQSAWGGSHYALLAFMLFFCTWHYRDYFESGKIVLFFSNLTYSVYLFHNWLYDFFLQIYNSKIIALITLFGFCYLCHIFIEKQGILLGKKVFRAWEAKQRSQPMTEIKDIA